MSETIKYYAIESWGWECPCGHWNEEDEDPGYQESLICGDCGKVFTDFEEE